MLLPALSAGTSTFFKTLDSFRLASKLFNTRFKYEFDAFNPLLQGMKVFFFQSCPIAWCNLEHNE